MIEQKFTLRVLRTMRNWTQIEAARRLGVAPSTLSFWENGISYPSVQHIKKICEVYGIPYDYIDFLPKGSL